MPQVLLQPLQPGPIAAQQFRRQLHFSIVPALSSRFLPLVEGAHRSNARQTIPREAAKVLETPWQDELAGIRDRAGRLLPKLRCGSLASGIIARYTEP